MTTFLFTLGASEDSILARSNLAPTVLLFVIRAAAGLSKHGNKCKEHMPFLVSTKFKFVAALQ